MNQDSRSRLVLNCLWWTNSIMASLGTLLLKVDKRQLTFTNLYNIQLMYQVPNGRMRAQNLLLWQRVKGVWDQEQESERGERNEWKEGRKKWERERNTDGEGETGQGGGGEGDGLSQRSEWVKKLSCFFFSQKAFEFTSCNLCSCFVKILYNTYSPYISWIIIQAGLSCI